MESVSKNNYRNVVPINAHGQTAFLIYQGRYNKLCWRKKGKVTQAYPDIKRAKDD